MFSIIWNYGNIFLLLFSEIMDYEASEISKEASKEEGSSKNTTPKNLLNGTMVWKLVYTLLQMVRWYVD